MSLNLRINQILRDQLMWAWTYWYANFFLKSFIVVSGLLSSSYAMASFKPLFLNALHCEYSYYNAPFASVQFQFDPQGNFLPTAEIEHYGKKSVESVTEVPPEQGEWRRVILSQESEENWLIVGFINKKSGFLMNPHIEFGQKMQGICTEKF